jgi:hypothetical protein
MSFSKKFFLALVVVFPVTVFASGVTLTNPAKFDNLIAFIEGIFTNIILPIGAVAVVFAVIYAGFLFVSGAGNEEKISRAKTTFLYTIIGSAVLLGSWTMSGLIRSTICEIVQSQAVCGGGSAQTSQYDSLGVSGETSDTISNDSITADQLSEEDSSWDDLEVARLRECVDSQGMFVNTSSDSASSSGGTTSSGVLTSANQNEVLNKYTTNGVNAFQKAYDRNFTQQETTSINNTLQQYDHVWINAITSGSSGVARLDAKNVWEEGGYQGPIHANGIVTSVVFSKKTDKQSIDGLVVEDNSDGSYTVSKAYKGGYVLADDIICVGPGQDTGAQIQGVHIGVVNDGNKWLSQDGVHGIDTVYPDGQTQNGVDIYRVKDTDGLTPQEKSTLNNFVGGAQIVEGEFGQKKPLVDSISIIPGESNNQQIEAYSLKNGQGVAVNGAALNKLTPEQAVTTGQHEALHQIDDKYGFSDGAFGATYKKNYSADTNPEYVKFVQGVNESNFQSDGYGGHAGDNSSEFFASYNNSLLSDNWESKMQTQPQSFKQNYLNTTTEYKKDLEQKGLQNTYIYQTVTKKEAWLKQHIDDVSAGGGGSRLDISSVLSFTTEFVFFGA